METKSKILAIAVVAMFCATAFAITAAEDDDAADKATYHIYIQLNDSTINATSQEKWLNAYDADAKSKDNYLKALKSGLDAANLKYEISDSGWLSSIGDYKTHGDWGSVQYYGFAVYYADGNTWKTTSTYDEGTTFAIVFDKYLTDDEYKALSESDKAKYEYNTYGYATLLPKVSTTSWETPADNTMIYIIVAIVAIIIIAVIAIYFIKKRNA